MLPRRLGLDSLRDEMTMSEHSNHNRRRFLGAAATAVAAPPLIFNGSAVAQPKPDSVPAFKPWTVTSFVPLKQIDAGFSYAGYS